MFCRRRALNGFLSEPQREAEGKAAFTVLTSSIDGVVTQLSVHTLGGVVKPADPLLAIVPNDEELIVEAVVLNKDIGFLREGQAAEVKLGAFPFTRYGVVNGTIERISRDSVENKELGLVFPCLVNLAASHIDVDAKRIALEPGFAATAEVKTGQRRIIELLLSPLSRRVQEAGREERAAYSETAAGGFGVARRSAVGGSTSAPGELAEGRQDAPAKQSGESRRESLRDIPHRLRICAAGESGVDQ